MSDRASAAQAQTIATGSPIEALDAAKDIH